MKRSLLLSEPRATAWQGNWEQMFLKQCVPVMGQEAAPFGCSVRVGSILVSPAISVKWEIADDPSCKPVTQGTSLIPVQSLSDVQIL